MVQHRLNIIRSTLLGGVALAAMAGASLADDVSAPGAVDIDTLAATAAPAPSSRDWLMSVSKTPQPQVPGLPILPRDLSRMGDSATTLRLLPAGESGGGSISWSGYSSAGIVYQGSKSR